MNKKYFIILFLITLFFGGISCSILEKRTTEVSEDFYANGVQKYRSETIIIGENPKELGYYKKTKTTIWKFYENGKQELVQSIIEKPAEATRNETTGEPMNKIPKIIRKYIRYDHTGKMTEKGWEKTRKSKNIQYNSGLYKKIITEKNQEWRFPKITYKGKLKPTKNLKIIYYNKNTAK